MNFCSNCGAPATGAAYCGNCGRPMTVQAATAAGQQGQPQAPTSPPPGAPVAGAAPVRANPFADIPALDYVRDIVALVLLLVSFGMPWDLTDSVTGKVYVILVTLLSVVSLSLPYLKRGGVLPVSWGTAELRLARLAANAPYVVVVLITLVLGYVGENGGDGVGVGMAFGLAGALLAAQGRQAEQVPDDGGDSTLWRWTATGIGALIALLTVVSLIIFLTDEADALEWEAITYVIVTMLFFAALAVVPRWWTAHGDAAWRDVLVLLGVVALFVGVWQLSAEQTMADAWSLSDAGPRLVLIPALAVAVSAPALRSRFQPAAGAAHWVAVATRMFQVAMLVAAVGVALYIITVIAVDDGRGVAIVVLVLHLILLVAAVVGRNALVREPNQGRAIAVICGGVFILLGIVIASILGASDLAFIDVTDATIISVLWWFGVALMLALTLPESVRQEFGPVGASQLSFGSVLPGGPAAGGGTASPDSAHSDAVPASPAVPGDGSRPDAAAETAHDEPAEDEAAAEEEATPAADEHEEATPAADDSQAEPLVTPDEPLVEPRPGPVSGLAAAADDTETRVDQPRAEPATRVDQQAVTDAQASGSSSGFDASTALDPNTPLQVLADIAAQEPGLRKHVAANPSTYPELLTWLGQLGDPEVDEALRRRAR